MWFLSGDWFEEVGEGGEDLLPEDNGALRGGGNTLWKVLARHVDQDWIAAAFKIEVVQLLAKVLMSFFSKI